MAQLFSKIDDPDHTRSSLRAAQAWQILVGMAMNRQTTTYLGLSNLMFGHDAPGVLARILGHIAYYCEQSKLPQLNIIVVGKDRGTPGHGIPANVNETDELREAVYKCKWFDVVPPTAEELDDAWRLATKKRSRAAVTTAP